MFRGIATGFLGYACFSSADACIKALGGYGMGVFEIIFLLTAVTFTTVAFVKPREDRWRSLVKVKQPLLVFLRTACAILGGFFGVYAFTTLPLAEAYALIFLAPIFTTVLSIPLLGEQVGWRRWTAVFIGFAGVLLVIRPGFRELHPGHLAAAVAALIGALGMILMRRLSPTEKRANLLTVVYIGVLVVNFPLMLLDFSVPSAPEIGLLIFSGLVGGAGQIAMLMATAQAPANRVAPAQYSQIIWAVFYGAVFFREYPDSIAFVGMALVAASGLITLYRERQVHGPSRRVHLGGTDPKV